VRKAKKGLVSWLGKKEKRMREVLRLNRKEGKEMKGLGLMVREEGVNAVRKEKEVEKMRKGLSVIVGIAILLFAYSASAGVVTNGLVSWWTFDETSGSTAYDSIGNNTGTVSGSLGWTTDTAGGASSGALYFDGTGDDVQIPHHSSLALDSNNNFTLECWLNVPSASAQQQIFWKGAWGNRGIVTTLNSPGNIDFYTFHQAAPEGSYANNFPTGGWMHLAVTRSGSSARIYFNGTDETDAAASHVDPTVSTDILYLGVNDTGGSRLVGIMDEVRIYDRVLSQGEIQQNIDAIPEPSTLLCLGAGLSGLLAFRRFRK